MLLKKLTLNNFRAFSHAEFTFQPGMNLIVGVNGVGKSTVLDALRILLSQILPKISKSRSRAIYFKDWDMSVVSIEPYGITQSAITTEVTLEVAKTEFRYLVHEPHFPPRTNFDPTSDIRNAVVYDTTDRYVLTPNDSKTLKALVNQSQQPIAVYFSPRRALANNSTKFTANGKNAAFADALDHRELRMMEFADWWFAQKFLNDENAPNAKRHISAMDTCISYFMDTCDTIGAFRETHTHKDDKGKLTSKSNGTVRIFKSGIAVDLRQLSDGERGILALVLDLTRRLSQANPNLEDPLQGRAVVLIDELDLHLHPQWQRSIVSKLTTTFPNCQFIATTHSPLIIGEVAPESVILIDEDGEIIHPSQSLGMDTDWILKYIMGAATRHTGTTLELEHIADLIEAEDYDEAIDAIDLLREKRGEFPELVRLQTRIDRFQMLGE